MRVAPSLIILVFVALLALMSSAYRLPENEQAVITRFGEP
jgi:regulator of protease activity HflC (stomatin/prohibitin superfamily)